MEQQPKARTGEVSRKMMVVLVAMLLVVLVPATVMSLPLSHIKVTIVNMSTEHSVAVYLSIEGYEDYIPSQYLVPEHEMTSTYSVTTGGHEVSVYTYYEGDVYYGGSYYESVYVVWFETEEVLFELYDPFPGNTTT